MQRCVPQPLGVLRARPRRGAAGAQRVLAPVAAAQRVVLQPTPRCKSLATAAELTLATFVVGSGAEAQVRVKDAAVAAAHARFDWRSGRLFVTDLESGGGTFFDGVCIRPGVAYSAADGVVVRARAAAEPRLALSDARAAQLCLGPTDAAAPTEFVIRLDPVPTQAGSVDAMLAEAFLARFRSGGSEDVKKLLD